MSTPIILGTKPLDPIQQSCVELLEEALEQARSGNVFAVGVALCMRGGFASVLAGKEAAELNLACDALKQKILAAVVERTSRKSPRL